ncbi:MAG TPA: hypothetical protein VLR94_12030 [Acidobacteriota bacterium]|nr:hypothetical protein [Acidobacteriota bacterium]
MKRVAVAFLLLWAGLVSGAASREAVLLNATFDDADLSGWRTVGDLCVAPAFCAGQPSGQYWIAMSTNSSSDSTTLCGFSSLGGVQTILRSPDLPLPFAPARIRVQFKVKFLTNENPTSDLGTDAFNVRLLTMAGPIVITSVDDSGPSPETKNLVVRGDPAFKESDCSSNWRFETGMLEISYDRTFRESVQKKMAEGPIAIEFSLANQFDTDFDSAIVLDDVRVQVFH